MKKVKVDTGYVTFGSVWYKYGVYEKRWFGWEHIKRFDDLNEALDYANSLRGLPHLIP